MKPPAAHGPFWLRRPSLAALQAIRDAQADQAVTYPDLGATRGDAAPAGYHWIRESADLGQGDAVFQRACAGLRAWAPQRHARMTVIAPDALTEGETVVLALRSGLVWTSVAGRIVYLTDEPERYGYAYGTLPHHPESGEEAFMVERGPDGAVRFVITAFSKPVHPLARLGGPLTSAVQRLATRRYLAGLVAAAEGAPPTRGDRHAWRRHPNPSDDSPQ